MLWLILETFRLKGITNFSTTKKGGLIMIEKLNLRSVALVLICLGGLLTAAGAGAYEAYIPEYTPVEETPAKAVAQQSYTETELMCLARNIYYEAGSEPLMGKIAVGMVTLNRMEDPRFPKDICGVVNHKLKSRISGKWVCQFSWVCQKGKKVPMIGQAWENSLLAAKNLLAGDIRETGRKFREIMFFHNTSVAPPKVVNLRRVMRIGNHYFYRG